MHELVKNYIKNIFNKVGRASKESGYIRAVHARYHARTCAQIRKRYAGLSPSSTHVRQ